MIENIPIIACYIINYPSNERGNLGNIDGGLVGKPICKVY